MSDELNKRSVRSKWHRNPLSEDWRSQASISSTPWADRKRGLLETFGALEAKFDIVMPDTRGHGKSSAPLTSYRYDDYVRDVVGLIQGLGLAAPVLLGHSMGGMIAAVVASQTAAAIRGLILADPTFLSPERQRDVYESDAVEQHRQLISLDRADALTRARVRHGHRRPEIIELVTEARMKTSTCAFGSNR